MTGAADNDDWGDLAACKDQGDLFFPATDVHGYRVVDQTFDPEPAKAICATCPAIKPCLAWALDNHEIAGVWGGLTELERRHLLGRDARGHQRRARRCRWCDHLFRGATQASVFCGPECRDAQRAHDRNVSNRRRRQERAS